MHGNAHSYVTLSHVLLFIDLTCFLFMSCQIPGGCFKGCRQPQKFEMHFIMSLYFVILLMWTEPLFLSLITLTKV